jgi:hypothetical protein
MKTTQEREQERRSQKLAAVEEQIRSGSLVVRKMTAAERARYPPRQEPPKRARYGGFVTTGRPRPRPPGSPLP